METSMMNTLRVSTRFAALALFGLPLFAAPSECERAERTRAELHNIRQRAARVQTNTDEFRAYLRNASADWRGLAYALAYVTEDVKNMQRALGRVYALEPQLTPRQQAELDHLDRSLATLILFLNGTNRALEDRSPIIFRRDEFDALAANMNVRSGAIRRAAKTIGEAPTLTELARAQR